MTFIDPTGHDSEIPSRDLFGPNGPQAAWESALQALWNVYWDSFYGPSDNGDDSSSSIVDQFVQELEIQGFTDIEIVDLNDKTLYASYDDPEKGIIRMALTLPGNGNTFAGVREIVSARQAMKDLVDASGDISAVALAGSVLCLAIPGAQPLGAYFGYVSTVSGFVASGNSINEWRNNPTEGNRAGLYWTIAPTITGISPSLRSLTVAHTIWGYIYDYSTGRR